jgi:hypothetical protein
MESGEGTEKRKRGQEMAKKKREEGALSKGLFAFCVKTSGIQLCCMQIS